ATGPQPAAPATPAQPVALRSAAIGGIDHRASGTAVLYRQPDGTYVVGLEGIDIQPGPDYDLYVVPGPGREEPGGGVGLGDLRGNKGTQFYPAPPGTELGVGEWTVLVWCEAFDVPIAAASLA
ncbi:MAG: DM13 domain-containing protein, partial [Acidimicrobiales bacterium]